MEKVGPVIGGAEAADALSKWASLAGTLRQKEGAVAWQQVAKLIKAAEPKLAFEANRLGALLGKSDEALSPLSDPLRTDFSLHRWLSTEREEAYSDWLKWVLEQLGSAGEVMEALAAKWIGVLPEDRIDVKREEWKRLPGWDQARKLDLVLRSGVRVRAVIEVKVISPEAPDLQKNQQYWEWLQYENKEGDAVLLALECTKEICKPFRLLTWSDLCVSLRRLLPGIGEKRGIVAGALVAGFIGAVEQNLLQLSQWPPSVLVCEHIEKSLESGGAR